MSRFFGAKERKGNIRFRCSGVSIYDDKGHLAGCVDRAGFNGEAFEVEGWVNAEKVTLFLGGKKAFTQPDLLREDVGTATGFSDTLGFYLRVPATLNDMKTSEPPGLNFDAAQEDNTIPALSLPISSK